MNAAARPRKHDEYEALAVAWAVDALEPAEQELFEAHHSECEDCALTVLATLKVATEMAYGVPAIEPPPLLRQRLLAAARPPPVSAKSDETSPSGSSAG